jgi:hypothetical protein
MVSTLSQASSRLGSTDGFVEAIVEAASESTSKCITDRGGVNFPHNSCNSGMSNITGALTPIVSSPSQANDTWGCGNGEGLARCNDPPLSNKLMAPVCGILLDKPCLVK